MKTLIRVFVPLAALGLCIWGDISLASWLFTKLPQDLSWLFWAKAGIVVGLIWATSGIIITITYITGAIAYVITEE